MTKSTSREAVDTKVEVLPAVRGSALREIETAVHSTFVQEGTHYAHGIFYRAMNGAWLAKAKQELPHGEFSKWVEKKFPQFTDRTARHRMDLAVAVLERVNHELSSKDRIADLTALDLPDPRDWKNAAANNKIIKALAAVVDGKTVRQFYLEAEIISEKKKKSNAPASSGDRNADHRANAQAFLDDLCEKLDGVAIFADAWNDNQHHRAVNALAAALKKLGVKIGGAK